MTKSEMITLVTNEVKGLSTYLDFTDYSNASDDAVRETGWAFPISGDFKIFWHKQRAKRHLFFYLLTESAHKFKFEQINLQHRFDHYKILVKQMDEDYLAVIEARPEMFSNADVFETFGTKIDAGFAYEPQTGRDLTYDSNQVVIHKPDSNS